MYACALSRRHARCSGVQLVNVCFGARWNPCKDAKTKMSCSERETNPSVYWFKVISGIEDFIILRRVYV